MAEQELGKFKGTLFGGFNRRSVTENVERLLKERNDYRARLEESEQLCETLLKDLNQKREDEDAPQENDWQQEKEALSAAYMESQGRADALENDLRTMAGRLRQVCLELNEKSGQLQTVNAQMEALQAQLESSRQQSEAAAAPRPEAPPSEYGAFRDDLLSTMDYLRRQLGRLDAQLEELEKPRAVPAAREQAHRPGEAGEVRTMSK